MISYLKNLKLAILLFGVISLFSNDLMAQNFIVSGSGTYNATCGGVIRLKADTSRIVGIGTASDTIPGVVDWNKSTAGQIVRSYYYQRLVVSGGNKTMESGIFVTGDACSTPLTGYANLSTYPFYSTAGTLNFGTGTFNYAGGTQTIYPTTDSYYILNVSSEATVATGTTVSAYQVNSSDDLDVVGTLTLGGGASTFTADVDVTGTLNTGSGTAVFSSTVDLVAGTLNTSSGNVALNGATTVDNASEVNVGAGNITFGSTLALDGDLNALGGPGGSGDVRFGGATTIGTTGTLNFGSGNNLFVGALLTNAGDGTNLNFNCGTNITYDTTALTIMPTLNIDGNRYGNLFVRGTNLKTVGTSSYGRDINICTNFSLSGSNLEMETGTLRMIAPTGTVTYAANEEVLGRFTRATNADARSYTFNNNQTRITLAASADNPDTLLLNVRPATAPNNYTAATDVNRKINLSYNGNSGHFAMTVRAGYLLDERSSWTAPYSQASLRFYEATTQPAREKVGTGEVYSKVAASGSNLGYVELAGIADTSVANVPNGIAHFASGNDLLLAAGPTTFYSVNDGRWTNPSTWDEGTIPTKVDDVEIRTLVYAGISGPFAGTLAAGNDIPEHTHYALPANGNNGNDSVANVITIANLPGAAFLLGNEDNPVGYIFKTRQATGTTFINNNTNAMTPAWNGGIAAKGTFLTNPGFNGVWITNYGANPAILNTNQIQSAGTINNEGIIEVGKE